MITLVATLFRYIDSSFAPCSSLPPQKEKGEEKEGKIEIQDKNTKRMHNNGRFNYFSLNLTSFPPLISPSLGKVEARKRERRKKLI